MRECYLGNYICSVAEELAKEHSSRELGHLADLIKGYG
jgi:hypothetical protein